MQTVLAVSHVEEMLARLLEACGLVHQPAVEVEGLVGADHQSASRAPGVLG